MQATKRWLVVASGAFALGWSAVSGAGQELFAKVTINGLTRLADAVEQVSASAGQPMPADEVLQGLGGALGSPTLAGLDSAGAFTLVVNRNASPDDSNFSLYLYAPVTGNGDAYRDALEGGMNKLSDENGVTLYQPKEGGMPPILAVKMTEGYAVLGMDPAAVAAAPDTAPAGAELGPPGVDSLVSIAANVQPLVEFLDPQIAKGLKQMDEAMEHARAGGEMGDMPPGMEDMNPAKILEIEADYGMRMLRQIQSVGLGLGLEQGSIRVYSQITPMSGSTFADVVAEARPPHTSLTRALPPNALLADVSYWPGFDAFMQGYGSFARELYGAMGETFAGLGDIMGELLGKLEGAYTGDFLFAVAPAGEGTSPTMVQAFRVADPDKVKALMDEYMTIMDSMSEIEGFTEIYKTYQVVKKDERVHRGAEIVSYAMEIEFGDAMAEAVPAPIAELIRSLTFDMAIADNTLVYTFGSSFTIENAVDALLDGTGTPIGEMPDYKGAFPGVDDQVIETFQWAVFDTLRAVVSILPEELTDKVPPVPEGPGRILGYSKVHEAGLFSEVAISLEDVATAAASVAAVVGDLQASGIAGGGPGSCMKNLRQLTLMGIMHSMDHDGQLPKDWTELADYADGAENLQALLRCPLAADDEGPSYELLPVGELGSLDSPQTTPLIREIEARHGGKRHVAFADGHVELQ